MSNKKLQDFDKVMLIVRSCKTSGQNNVAYVLVHQFEKMYGRDSFSEELFSRCDENLLQMCREV